MREIPVLFRGPMVRAILEGRKTQTRRPVKGWALEWLQPGMFTPEYVALPSNHASPFGFAGDQLWVRETWGVGTRPDPYEGWVDGIEYRADCHYLDDHDLLPLNRVTPPDDVDLDTYAGKWRPSIHMPRWASRLQLGVTGIRVERLQDMSDVDADAEGFDGDYPTRAFPEYFPGNAEDYAHLTIPQCFGRIWDALAGPGSWDANPWVWVVEFEPLEAGRE